MAFTTYPQGLKQAKDLANKAIAIEASLSTLSPVVSPLPTLEKAFPIYITAAETYSHLLASKLVPPAEVPTVKKRWRLVLERAEKIKGRIEELGGRVGKAAISEDAEESAVVRRGGRMNGVELELWSTPSDREFIGEKYEEGTQPELAEEQARHRPLWKALPESAWEEDGALDGWSLRQGPVADCSVIAGLGVILEHDRRHDTNLAVNKLHPQSTSGRPRRSENGKHVLRLLLNGSWRGVVIDSLLPFAPDGTPLFTTAHPTSPSSSGTGPAWVPLLLKGYFKAFGGYSIKGSNPAPDIYALTGWIPEHLTLKAGFQREKEWERIYSAWREGKVMVSLGTGEQVSEGLVKLHAYGVMSLNQEGDERTLVISDPGANTFTMPWDQVCAEYETLHLNWDPGLFVNNVKRHWSWPKPISVSTTDPATLLATPQYRLRVQHASGEISEIWLLLSQHITSKDRPLDDIALHVMEEYGRGQDGSASHPPRAQRTESASPYTNSVHVLVRCQLRRTNSTLLLLPARDRGNFQTGFTLLALSPSNTSLTLERIARQMPFSQNVSAVMDIRNAGGHPGCPTHVINPQYRLEVGQGRGDIRARVLLQGHKEVAWNVKVVWGKGQLVADLTGDMVVADTRAYAFGMAYCDIPEIKPGVYTVIVSAFEAGQTGGYTLSLEGTAPLTLSAIPAEGAGMYSRMVRGAWTEETAGGRPSAGSYDQNPKIELLMSKPGTVLARLYLPTPSPTPINLTLFARGPGGQPADQITTTGPYINAISGISLKVKLDPGIYVLIPSAYERGTKGGWVLKIWSDVGITAEVVR